MKTFSIRSYLMAIILSVISITAVISCASKEDKSKYEGVNKVSTLEANDAPPETTAGGQKKSASEEESSPTNTNITKEKDAPTSVSDNTIDKIPQKIIKTADIAFQVESYKESRKKILEFVKKNKALVSVERETNDGYRISNDMVIRVFSDSFDNLIDEIITCSIYLESKNINAEDVTEEYVDISARLKTKKETENQYLEILKKARSIDEILAVQAKLQGIREEIESSQGRLKYLDNRAQYSTINLKFYEKLPNVIQPDDSFGYRVKRAIGTGWQGLVGFFIGLIYIWPLILIGLLVTYFILWLVKRKRKKRLLKQQKQ